MGMLPEDWGGAPRGPGGCNVPASERSGLPAWALHPREPGGRAGGAGSWRRWWRSEWFRLTVRRLET